MIKKPIPTQKPEPRDYALSLRIRRSVRDGLERAAIDDRRTISGLAEVILEQWLKEKGFLK